MVSRGRDDDGERDRYGGRGDRDHDRERDSDRRRDRDSRRDERRDDRHRDSDRDRDRDRGGNRDRERDRGEGGHRRYERDGARAGSPERESKPHNDDSHPPVQGHIHPDRLRAMQGKAPASVSASAGLGHSDRPPPAAAGHIHPDRMRAVATAGTSRPPQNYDHEEPPELYKIYTGTVKKVEAFGAFIAMDGFNSHGLLHVSQLSSQRIENANDVVNAEERVFVKVIEINNDTGKRRIGLTIRDVDQRTGEDADPNNLNGSKQARGRKPRTGGEIDAISSMAILDPMNKMKKNDYSSLGIPSVQEMEDLENMARKLGEARKLRKEQRKIDKKIEKKIEKKKKKEKDRKNKKEKKEKKSSHSSSSRRNRTERGSSGSDTD